MDTFWHAFWAYILFRKKPYVPLVVLGSILPDLATLLTLGLHFLTQGFGWDSFTAVRPAIRDSVFGYLAHSMVIIVALAILSALFWKKALPIFYGMGLHAIMDYATHYGDNAYPLYPFSTWKIVSPISFWETTHYSIPFMIVNTLLAVVLMIYLLHTIKHKDNTLLGLMLFCLAYTLPLIVFFVINSKITEAIMNGIIPLIFFLWLARKQLFLRSKA